MTLFQSQFRREMVTVENARTKYTVYCLSIITLILHTVTACTSNYTQYPKYYDLYIDFEFITTIERQHGICWLLSNFPIKKPPQRVWLGVVVLLFPRKALSLCDGKNSWFHLLNLSLFSVPFVWCYLLYHRFNDWLCDITITFLVWLKPAETHWNFVTLYHCEGTAFSQSWFLPIHRFVSTVIFYVCFPLCVSPHLHLHMNMNMIPFFWPCLSSPFMSVVWILPTLAHDRCHVSRMLRGWLCELHGPPLQPEPLSAVTPTRTDTKPICLKHCKFSMFSSRVDFMRLLCSYSLSLSLFVVVPLKVWNMIRGLWMSLSCNVQ